MSCPRCGNTDGLYSYSEDPAGTVRCGKCGNHFTAAEAGNLGALREILEEIKKINARIEKIERLLPSVQFGGCPNCGCGHSKFLGSNDLKDFYKCEFCHYKFEREHLK